MNSERKATGMRLINVIVWGGVGCALVGVAVWLGAGAGSVNGTPDALMNESKVSFGETNLVAVDAPSTQDLGRLAVGARAERTIMIRNVSPDVVKLEIINKTCGCVDAVLEPSELNPGQSAKLLFGLDVYATTVPGAIVQGVAVEARSVTGGRSLDSASWIGRFTLSVEPDVSVYVYPPRMNLMGYEGSSMSGEIYVRPAEGEGLTIRDVHCTLIGFDITSIDGPTAMGGYIIRFGVDRTTTGVTSGDIRFFTNSSQLPAIRVPVLVRVKAGWRATPDAVLLTPTDSSRQTVEGILTVQKASPDLRLSPLESIRVSEGHGVQAALRAVSQSDEYEVRVRVDIPAFLAASGAARIDLMTEAGDVAASVPILWLGEM